jgi:hypothetical protein
MPSEVFEPAIPSIDRPQTYALEHTATGLDLACINRRIKSNVLRCGLLIVLCVLCCNTNVYRCSLHRGTKYRFIVVSASSLCFHFTIILTFCDRILLLLLLLSLFVLFGHGGLTGFHTVRISFYARRPAICQ